MITQRIPPLAIGLVLLSVSLAPGQELPGWLDHVTITPPPPGGLTAVTLGGVWNNTCVPNAISHVDAGRQIKLTVSQPGLNVFCGQAFTPWSLTEEIGPLQAGTHPIAASLISVDPTDRNIRQRLAGPDFIGQVEPKRAEFRGLGAGDVYNSRAYDVSADGRVVVGSKSWPTPSESQPNLVAFAWGSGKGDILLFCPLFVSPGKVECPLCALFLPSSLQTFPG